LEERKMKRFFKAAAGALFASTALMALASCQSNQDEFVVDKPTPNKDAIQIIGDAAFYDYDKEHEGKTWEDFGYKAYTYIIEEKRDTLRLTKKETLDFESSTLTLEEYIYEKDENENYQKKGSLKASRFFNDSGNSTFIFDISFNECKIPNSSLKISGDLSAYFGRYEPIVYMNDYATMVVFNGIPHSSTEVYVLESESYLYYAYDNEIDVYKNDLMSTAYMEDENSTIGIKVEYFTTSKEAEKTTLDGRVEVNINFRTYSYASRHYLYEDILSEYNTYALAKYFTITEA
jgi:hypothetical protein